MEKDKSLEETSELFRRYRGWRSNTDAREDLSQPFSHDVSTEVPLSGVSTSNELESTRISRQLSVIGDCIPQHEDKITLIQSVFRRFLQLQLPRNPKDTSKPEDQKSLQKHQRQVTECKSNQFQGPGGNVDVELIDKNLNRYRVHFPTAGWYLWPATGLGFDVREVVTVTIAFESWSQHLDLALQQDDRWMVSGPLFDITAEPEQAISKIHLPHFISLQGGEVDTSLFKVAHFKDEGMILEQPTLVEPFYVVLENPSFSLIGVLLWIASGTGFSVPVTSTTLIYYHHHPEEIRFHVYLIPSDCVLTKSIDEEEDRFHGVRLQTSPPVEPLNFGSCYIVSGYAHLEIVPKELKLSYRSPGEIQPFSKVYAGQMKEPIQLKITDKRLGSLVWETLVKPVDLEVGAASTLPTFSGAAFVREHHRQLQARMGNLGGVLDDLQDNRVLTEDEKELVEQAQTRQRKNETLLRMVENKGEPALELLYTSLSKRDPYLVSFLRQPSLSL